MAIYGRLIRSPKAARPAPPRLVLKRLYFHYSILDRVSTRVFQGFVLTIEDRVMTVMVENRVLGSCKTSCLGITPVVAMLWGYVSM